MKLSEYKEEKINKQEAKEKIQEKNEPKIEDLYAKYKNMDQNSLMQELVSQVSKQKQDGTFDYDKLNKTIQSVMPYLTEQQKNNLLSIISQLK